MITTLPLVDLSGLSVGQQIKVNWATLIQFPLSGEPPSIAVYNESGVGFTCKLNVGGQSWFLPAGGWQRIEQMDPKETGLIATAVYILPSAPVTKLAVVYYNGESANLGPGMLGNSPVGVSAVPQAVTQVIQDNQPTGQIIVEATPTGQAQNVLITTDGAAKLTSLVDAVPVTPSQFGTPIGGVTFGGAAAVSGDATAGSATFDGTTGYVNVPVTGLPTGNPNLSIEAWIFLTGNPSGNAIIGGYGTRAAHERLAIFINSSGQAAADTFLGATAFSAALSLNTWHQVVGTWDGTNLTCYVDGAQTAAATPGAMTIPGNSNGAAFGSDVGGSSFIGCRLAECALYASALSAARVSAHFTAGSAGGYKAAVAADVPARYYRLNDPAGGGYANSTIASSLATVGTDGSSALGRVASVGGQASVGGLGMPVIVAQAINTAVTVTTQQTVLTYTPSAAGLYRISGSFYTNNTGTIKPNLKVTYFGGNNIGTLLTVSMTAPNGAVYDGVSTTVSSGFDLALLPQVLYLAANQALTMSFTDNQGTPNDHVSYLVERLA